VIVYGTQLAPDLNFQQALLIANDWFLYSNGNVSIKEDTEITQEIAQEFNLILIGGPAKNSWTAKVQSTLPVSFSGTSFTIGPRKFDESETAVIFLGPSSNGNLLLVIAGIDEGLALNYVPNQSGITVPDYLVIGPEAKWQADGGILAAGYWGNNWEYLPEMAYIK